MCCEIGIVFGHCAGTAYQAYNRITGRSNGHEKTRSYIWVCWPPLLHLLPNKESQEEDGDDPSKTLISDSSDYNGQSLHRGLTFCDSRRHGPCEHGIEDEQKPCRRHLNHFDGCVLEERNKMDSRGQKGGGRVYPEQDSYGYYYPGSGVWCAVSLHAHDDRRKGEPESAIEVVFRWFEEAVLNSLRTQNEASEHDSDEEREEDQIEDEYHESDCLQTVELMGRLG